MLSQKLFTTLFAGDRLSLTVGSTTGSSGRWNQGFCITPAASNCAGRDTGKEKRWGGADARVGGNAEGRSLTLLRAALLSRNARLCPGSGSPLLGRRHFCLHSLMVLRCFLRGNMPQLPGSSAFRGHVWDTRSCSSISPFVKLEIIPFFEVQECHLKLWVGKYEFKSGKLNVFFKNWKFCLFRCLISGSKDVS